MALRNSKIASSILISIIYILSFLIVFYFFPLFQFSQSMLKVLIADVVATIVVFVFSMILSNSSVYDPYWSVAPPFIVLYLMKLFPEGNQLRQYVIVLLVLFWSIRLTVNWLRGWQGFDHQDWRYTSIAEKTGIFYWPVSFLGIHLMPTIFVFLGCLPLWFSLSSTAPFGLMDFLAAIFTFLAILIEWIADEQLLIFRKNKSTNSFIRSGLWKYSRHPNYLGEICFWGGMLLFAVSSNGITSFTGYWTGIGLVSMIILFNFISIPLMEKRNISRKPGYAEYIKNVPALLPRLFSSAKIEIQP
jgi:steroid 5-alpha reductase family enzyme